MIKRFCDRCGKEIEANSYSDVFEYHSGELDIELYRKPKHGYAHTDDDAIELCRECGNKLKDIIEDFLSHSEPDIDENMLKAFAVSHECCGGCID